MHNLKQIRIGILEDHLMIQQYLSDCVNELIAKKKSRDSPNKITLDFVVDTFDKLKSELHRKDSVPPDVLLLDLLFGKSDQVNGKDVAIYLSKYYIQTKIIIISDLLEDKTLAESLLKIPNVKACLSKSEVVRKRELLGDTILKVALIKLAKSYKKEKDVVEPIIDEIDAVYEIEVATTVRGFEISPFKKPILHLLATGKTSRQMAEKDCLNKAQQTIDKHLAELRELFNVATNEALMVKAIYLGVLRFTTR